MKTLGLGGILTFNTRAAVASMNRASVAFTRLEQSMVGIGAATTKAAMMIGRVSKAAYVQLKLLGGAARNAALAVKGLVIGLLPMALIVGKGMKAAIAFERQMSAVQAILGKTKQEMAPLAKEARHMGIVSVFSATQAAEAMEAMARAGFKNTEIMSGLKGVMDAAAAEGLNLADATSIVANQIRAFSLGASSATHVADVLALASARANTNIMGLGEGLKFVAPIARGLGISLEDAAATLALLADSGLKGSLAGTAMKNAMLKLAAPSGTQKKILTKLGLVVADSTGKFVGMESVLNQLATGMNSLGGKVNRTAVAARLFGLRGVGLTNLLSRLKRSGKDGAITFSELAAQLRNASKVAKDKFGKDIGAAALMAQTRLDNVSGRLTLLKSSLESLGILTFQPMLGGVASDVRSFTENLNSVLSAIQDIRLAITQGTDAAVASRMAVSKYGSTAVAIAQGIMSATDALKKSWQNLTTWISNAGKAITKHLGKDGVRSLTKFLVRAASMSTVLIPIALGIAFIGLIMKMTLIPAIKSVGLMFRFAFTPMGLIVGGIILLIVALRKENESLGDTIKRVWKSVAGFMSGVWEFLKNTVGAFFGGFFSQLKGIFSAVKKVFGAIERVFSTVFGWMFSDTKKTTQGMKSYFGDFGAFVGQVLIGVLRAVSTIFNAIDDFIHDGRSAFQDFMKASERQWLTMQLGIGAISQKEYQNELKRLKRIGSMIDDDRKQRANFVREREQEIRSLQKLNEQATQSTVAPIIAAERKLNVNVSSPVIQDKRVLEVKNTMCVDGREVAVATSRHQTEVHERGGFKKTPWNRRAVSEFGVLELSTAK